MAVTPRAGCVSFGARSPRSAKSTTTSTRRRSCRHCCPRSKRWRARLKRCSSRSTTTTATIRSATRSCSDGSSVSRIRRHPRRVPCHSTAAPEIVGSMARTAVSIPRVELALGPTPLLKLERLSAELGVELWVKRDDLTGLLESGNKIRKLEFLVGEALAERADTLITCGTLQSNCCRAASAVAARLGMRAVLALKGAPPDEYDGNLLLDHLLGAEVHYCDDAAWDRIEDVMADLAARVRARGGVPYVVPERGA